MTDTTVQKSAAPKSPAPTPGTPVSSGQVSSATVPAWDLPTRLFKWALVVLVVSGWASNEFGAATPAWHVWNGYAVLVAVVFRVLWGIVGGSTARFARFLAGPAATLRYGLAAARGREPHFLGHNPLAGWMVVALLALVGAMAVSGLFNAEPDRIVIEGSLSTTLSDAAVHLAHRLHGLLFTLIELAVVLHVAAVAYHALVKKEPLVRAMVTGRKPAAPYADAAAATPGSILTAVLCLAAAIALVWGGIAWAGSALAG